MRRKPPGRTFEHGEGDDVEELADIREGQKPLQLDHPDLQTVRIQKLVVLVRPVTTQSIHPSMTAWRLLWEGGWGGDWLPFHGRAEHAEVGDELDAARLVELEGEEQHGQDRAKGLPYIHACIHADKHD